MHGLIQHQLIRSYFW